MGAWEQPDVDLLANRLPLKVAGSFEYLHGRWETVLSWSESTEPEESGSLSIQLLNNDAQPSSFLISSQISRLKFLRVHIFFTTHDKLTNKKTTKNKQNQTCMKLLPHGIWKHFFSLSAIIGKSQEPLPECSAGERDLELSTLAKTKKSFAALPHVWQPTSVFGKD